jgi:hypothetical protein
VETPVPKHPLLEIVKIPNARMLVLDDQPQAADDAIATFVKKIGKDQSGSEKGIIAGRRN